MRCDWLESFVLESWRIEGLRPAGADLAAVVALHREFLECPAPDVRLLAETASALTWGAARLRVAHGMDVRVGSHVAPPGGPEIEPALRGLLIAAQEHDLTPYRLHQEFERLHPFLDGNGRAGRLVWAWMMEDLGHDPAWRERGFLHTWYYQSLEDSDRR